MIKKHNFYPIDTTRVKMYAPGELVVSLEELLGLGVVYVVPWNRAHPVAFIQNWQLRFVAGWLAQGRFRKAIKVQFAGGEQQ